MPTFIKLCYKKALDYDSVSDALPLDEWCELEDGELSTYAKWYQHVRRFNSVDLNKYRLRIKQEGLKIFLKKVKR